MPRTALQEGQLAELHGRALRLRDALRAAWSVPVAVAAEAPTRAQAALSRLTAATQLMETISWLLVCHTGDATPVRWRAGTGQVPRGLTGERATVATAIGRLYAECVAIDTGQEP